VKVTEVRIKLINDIEDRLRAFCSITLDGEFVVRDLKIIQGLRGCFVAMPSRKILERCVNCHGKNEIKARFCANCGTALSATPVEASGRTRMFADIAHPINAECRERIEGSVLLAFEEEMQKSRQPGYVCRYDDYDE
jgi:stage V sporulation protein G